MHPSNEAAWLVAKCSRPLQVASAPYPSPRPRDVIVKTGAVAINPVDSAKQQVGNLIQSYVKYVSVQEMSILLPSGLLGKIL